MAIEPPRETTTDDGARDGKNSTIVYVGGIVLLLLIVLLALILRVRRKRRRAAADQRRVNLNGMALQDIGPSGETIEDTSHYAEIDDIRQRPVDVGAPQHYDAPAFVSDALYAELTDPTLANSSDGYDVPVGKHPYEDPAWYDGYLATGSGRYEIPVVGASHAESTDPAANIRERKEKKNNAELGNPVPATDADCKQLSNVYEVPVLNDRTVVNPSYAALAATVQEDVGGSSAV